MANSSRRLAVISDGKKTLSVWGAVNHTPPPTAAVVSAAASPGTSTATPPTAPTPPSAASIGAQSSGKKYPNSALGANRQVIAEQVTTSNAVPQPHLIPEVEAPANWEDDV